MIFFVENLQNPSLYIKEQNKNSKLKVVKYFFNIPKNGQYGFWSVQEKTKEMAEFLFSFCFLIKLKNNFVSGATYIK